MGIVSSVVFSAMSSPGASAEALDVSSVVSLDVASAVS